MSDIDEILDKRWDDPADGTVHKYNGHLRRKTPMGWLATDAESDDKVYRLTDASGLWKNDAARRIGMALVIEAVEAARGERGVDVLDTIEEGATS